MRLLAVTGASGGHIFPALSLLAELKKKQSGIEAVLVLPKKNIKYGAIPEGYEVRRVSISSLAFKPELKNLKALLNFFKGSLESLVIFFEFRPDIVVGFGSLNSIPLILLGWLFRVKTMIHEQNVIPGRANRLLAKFCDRIAVSFEETKNYLKGSKDRFIFSGNPLRQQLQRIDRARALDFLGFSEYKFTILVTGGSQGSHNINTAFVKALPIIAEISRFQVIHISGEQDFDSLNKAYAGMELKVKLYAFLKEMQYAYSVADLAISRAGATTVAELISFRVPAIIIPYPFAYRHQQANAAVLENRGAAVVIRDDQLTPQALAKTINEISKDSEKAKGLRASYAGISLPEANSVLAEAVLSLALN